MAHYLQALALMFAAGGFSHRPHLDLKLTCASCHSSAAASTRAADNLLPQAESCAPCHEDSQVRTAPTRHFVAKFNHAAHAGMLNCQGCHRLKEGAANPGFPKMAFCIGCHNKIDVPDSCMKCHLPTQELKPSSHNPAFFDLHSSGKLQTKNAGCAVCHGRNFTCQGCH